MLIPYYKQCHAEHLNRSQKNQSSYQLPAFSLYTNGSNYAVLLIPIIMLSHQCHSASNDKVSWWSSTQVMHRNLMSRYWLTVYFASTDACSYTIMAMLWCWQWQSHHIDHLPIPNQNQTSSCQLTIYFVSFLQGHLKKSPVFSQKQIHLPYFWHMSYM